MIVKLSQIPYTRCDFCNSLALEVIISVKNNIEIMYAVCNVCDSTYNIEDDE